MTARNSDSRSGGAVFSPVAASTYRLKGALTFATVAAVRSQGRQLLHASGEGMSIELQEVDKIDSAGLALLIDWLAEARHLGRQLRYVEPPPALLALAKLSEVTQLLIG
jgi:phospholipid transport system transporter-binding protein